MIVRGKPFNCNNRPSLASFNDLVVALQYCHHVNFLLCNIVWSQYHHYATFGDVIIWLPSDVAIAMFLATLYGCNIIARRHFGGVAIWW